MPPANSPNRCVNRLLAVLPETERLAVLAGCEPVELQVGQVINESGERIRDVYFPTDSFVSLVSPPAGHAGLEVWLVGNEGMVGAPLVLGVDVAVLRTLVQGAGRPDSRWARRGHHPRPPGSYPVADTRFQRRL